MNGKIRNVFIVLLAGFVLGVLMGGVYSVPALYLTKGREPWYTISLGIGLSATVAAISFGFAVSIPFVFGGWIIAMSVLLTRRSFGKLDGSLERFGLVHVFALVGMGWLALLRL